MEVMGQRVENNRMREIPKDLIIFGLIVLVFWGAA
jgi:hypothetical protein